MRPKVIHRWCHRLFSSFLWLFQQWSGCPKASKTPKLFNNMLICSRLEKITCVKFAWNCVKYSLYALCGVNLREIALIFFSDILCFFLGFGSKCLTTFKNIWTFTDKTLKHWLLQLQVSADSCLVGSWHGMQIARTLVQKLHSWSYSYLSKPLVGMAPGNVAYSLFSRLSRCVCFVLTIYCIRLNMLVSMQNLMRLLLLMSLKNLKRFYNKQLRRNQLSQQMVTQHNSVWTKFENS